MSILRFNARGVDVQAAQRLINDYFARNRYDITPSEIDRAIATVARQSPGFSEHPDAAEYRARARKDADKLIAAGWVIAADGDFGNMTDIAVRIVQANEDGLAIDGTIGPMTWARLEQRAIEPVEAEDPTKNGIPINGVIYPVAGHKVIGPHDAAWAHLAPGDARKRPRNPDGSLKYWIRQWIIHKTIADDPEILLEGAGPTGLGRRTAEYWQNDPIYGGAQVIFADDGEIDCLCDLWDVEAFHATRSNPWSVGSETREVGPLRGQKGGKFYRAGFEATVDGIMVAAPKLGIQLQMQRRGTYTGHPIKRMDDVGATPGGPDMVGLFGHRLNTERRGKWDPGELIFDELARRGVEEFDFDKREDIQAWKDRQSDLVRAGHTLEITGIADPKTVEALKLEGYIDGIWALGKAA